MKTDFNFKNIKGMLSRDEMKQIKGGQLPPSCPLSCSSADCVSGCECFHQGTKNEYCGSH